VSNLHRIHSLDDPRLDPYRHMKDRDLARSGARFIAEAEQVVRRLLASDYPTDSVLTIERKADALAQVTPADVPLYVIPNALLNEVMGFKFHSGVIACGRRKPGPALADLLPDQIPATLVVCPETNNTENLGLIIRVAAGFGATALLLGEKSANPFYRQSIRVSMGTIFSLPIIESDNLARDLTWLRNHQVELVATVADARAQPLAQARPTPRMALLFGAEGHGLRQPWLQLCHRQITIPMQLGTDSLNVHVAAAVFLYHFTHL
jgi:tRNA G18 (ribose-2'-O)-methylase SpoU